MAKKGIFLREEVGFKPANNTKKSQVITKKPAKTANTRRK